MERDFDDRRKETNKADAGIALWEDREALQEAAEDTATYLRELCRQAETHMTAAWDEIKVGRTDCAHEAIACWEQALKLCEEAADWEQMADILADKGEMHILLMRFYEEGYFSKDGNGYKAIDCFESAIKLYQRFENRDKEAETLKRLLAVEDYFYRSQY